MDNFILIDSKTREPVPLPFHTKTVDDNLVTIKDCTDPGRLADHPQGLVWWFTEPDIWRCQPPQTFGLELITEADFMAERS